MFSPHCSWNLKKITKETFVPDESVPLASIERHRQFWIHYLNYDTQFFKFCRCTFLFYVWHRPPSPHKIKEIKKEITKKERANTISNSSAELSYLSRDVRRAVFMTAGTEWNRSLLKLQSQSCFHTRMDILRGEKNEAKGEKEKKGKGEDNVTTGNVLEVQCICFPCAYQERRVCTPTKQSESSSKEKLLFAFSCRQVQGEFVLPVVLYSSSCSSLPFRVGSQVFFFYWDGSLDKQ